MAKDFIFMKHVYQITKDGKNIQCYIQVMANHIASMDFLINFK